MGTRNQAFLMPLKGTYHEKFVSSHRKSNTYVRVALATTGVQKTKYQQLRGFTWRIGTMVLPEQYQTMAIIQQCKTVNRLVCNQLHLIHTVQEQTKEVYT